MTESDKIDLIDVYFERCNTDFRSEFEKQEVRITIRLVTYTGECKNTDEKIVNNTARKTQGVREILRIVAFIIAGIGLIGALLSISVFCRPSYIAAHHISYYCLARSCSDCLMLVFCIITIYNPHLEFSFKRDSDEKYESVDLVDYMLVLQCVFVFVGFMISEIATALLTLAMSIERLVSIRFPLKSKVYLTSRLTRRVTFGVICISVLIPLAFFLATYLTNSIDYASECPKFSQDPSTVEFLYFSIIWAAVVILSPWGMILVVTVLTVLELRKAAKKRGTMTSPTNNAAAQNDPHKRTKMMSLVIAFTFLAALVPEIIMNVFGILQASDVSQLYLAVHLNNVQIVLLAGKSSLGFFLYFATNDGFRQVILGYCKLCCRCKRPGAT